MCSYLPSNILLEEPNLTHGPFIHKIYDSNEGPIRVWDENILLEHRLNETLKASTNKISNHSINFHYIYKTKGNTGNACSLQGTIQSSPLLKTYFEQFPSSTMFDRDIFPWHVFYWRELGSDQHGWFRPSVTLSHWLARRLQPPTSDISLTWRVTRPLDPNRNK